MDNRAENKPRFPKLNPMVIILAIFAAYAFFGFSDNVKGPALPRIQADLVITELQLGLLLAINVIGYIISCSFTAALVKKIGMKTCLLFALAIMAVSGIGICFSTGYFALVSSFFCLNLGNGMLEVSLGISAAKAFIRNTGAMMNLAHSFYGIGAIIGPMASTGLMAFSLQGQTLGWRYMYLVVLCCAIVPAVPVIFGRFGKTDKSEKKTGYAAMLKKPTLWLVILILSLGSVCEMGVGAWFVNFLEKAHSFPEERAAFFLTLFFVCFTLTRLALGPVIDKVGLINSLVIGLAFAGTLIVIGVLSGEPGAYLLVVAGIGIAPVFPTLMAVVAKLFLDTIDLAITVVVTITGITMVGANFLLGGIINFARRLFTDTYGDSGVAMAYSAGYLFLGLCCLGAFVVALILRMKQKKAGLI